MRREDGHVLIRALEFEIEGEKKKGMPKRAWKMCFANECGLVALVRLLLD